MRHLFIICSFLFIAVSAMAQDAICFDLAKKDGHLFFNADVCGEQVGVMLESGLPALLMGREFYERNLSHTLANIVPSKEHIRLFRDTYDIILKAYDDINIGGANYHGPIFILDNFDGMRIPVQYFTDHTMHPASVILDFANHKMMVLSSNDASNYSAVKNKFHYDKDLGFPLVSAKIAITTPDGMTKLKGTLLIDFGNPMVLFLVKQHKELTKAVKKGKIVPVDAHNQRGEIVAQGIYANELSFCGATFSEVSIGITPQSFNHLGLLGLSFFEQKKVLFNFDKAYFQILTN